MPFHEMNIKGAWIQTPIRHKDERGHFEEQFKLSLIESELGRSFIVKQANQSVSNKGVIRGIHYTDSPEGQAKYVSCPKGAIWDVVVDLRKDSATYGQWDAVEVSANNGLSVFISEGLGHAFLVLEENTVVNYLCTSEFEASTEIVINALDELIGIDFKGTGRPYGITNFIRSYKDTVASSIEKTHDGINRL